MAGFPAGGGACSGPTAPVLAMMPACPQPRSAVAWVASEAAMLASSWARAGGAVASRRTRSAADARSAARSRVMLMVLARGEGLADDGDGDAPGGTMSLAW